MRCVFAGRTGFTLAEVIIALAVVGILAGMVVPVVGRVSVGLERAETRLIRAAGLGRAFDAVDAALLPPGTAVRTAGDHFVLEPESSASVGLSVTEGGLVVELGGGGRFVVPGVGGLGVRSLAETSWEEGVVDGARALELRVWFGPVGAAGGSPGGGVPDLVRVVPVGPARLVAEADTGLVLTGLAAPGSGSAGAGGGL
ncbi:MAG: prepilin-type N-terminal cleavage/methylation domain-containing protein [Planctomycetota bacterium]